MSNVLPFPALRCARCGSLYDVQLYDGEPRCISHTPLHRPDGTYDLAHDPGAISGLDEDGNYVYREDSHE